MLIYNRTNIGGERDDLQPQGNHAWYNERGQLALWRGASQWYYDDSERHARILCPADWPDGDAIAMYRAKLKAAAIRNETR